MIVCCLGCDDNKDNSIQLNNQAMQIRENALFGVEVTKDSLFLESLELLNEAIRVDSSNNAAYGNKANVLISLGRYEEAIITLEILINRSPNNPSTITIQGWIYEKIGNQDNAIINYKEVIKIWQTKALNNPDDLDVKSELIMAKLFLNRKEESLNEIDSLVTLYPNYEPLLMMKEMVHSFDKESFLNNR